MNAGVSRFLFLLLVVRDYCGHSGDYLMESACNYCSFSKRSERASE